jgi:hypothetical protein
VFTGDLLTYKDLENNDLMLLWNERQKLVYCTEYDKILINFFKSQKLIANSYENKQNLSLYAFPQSRVIKMTVFYLDFLKSAHIYNQVYDWLNRLA